MTTVPTAAAATGLARNLGKEACVCLSLVVRCLSSPLVLCLHPLHWYVRVQQSWWVNFSLSELPPNNRCHLRKVCLRPPIPRELGFTLISDVLHGLYRGQDAHQPLRGIPPKPDLARDDESKEVHRVRLHEPTAEPAMAFVQVMAICFVSGVQKILLLAESLALILLKELLEGLVISDK